MMGPEPLDIALRPASFDDVASMLDIIEPSITELLGAVLSPTLVEGSRAIMGLDGTLIEDGTYWVAIADGVLCGCGGWSRRGTVYGGDHTAGRDARNLDPSSEPARIRAMYTHPSYARRGIGRAILARCEAEARGQGFKSAELVATLAGLPLYQTCGYTELARFEDGGVPLVRMTKALSPDAVGAVDRPSRKL